MYIKSTLHFIHEHIIFSILSQPWSGIAKKHNIEWEQ